MNLSKLGSSLYDFPFKVIEVKRLRFLSLFLALFAISALASALPALADNGPESLQAQSVAAGVPDPVRDVIQRQMAAIRARDAETAFSLTTGDLHEKFSSSKDFLTRLRWEHSFIYNHRDFTFLERRNVPGGFVQTLEVRDRYSNDRVTVLIRVEEQEDGEWLIDSYAVLEADAQPI